MFLQQLANFFISFCFFCLCIAISWLILSGQNFHYGFWYQQLDIKQVIDRYAPQNRFGKGNFATTESTQHEKLFSEIVHSINADGAGLEEIRYSVANQQYPLFTEAEIQHLQDVANLISAGRQFSYFIIGITLILFVVVAIKKINPVKLRWHFGGAAMVIVLLGLLIVILGPTNVFYWLHIQIFPKEHQWFFFYQDSLMSTMMRAPVLFAPIAVVWLALSVVIWAGLIICFNNYLKRLRKV